MKPPIITIYKNMVFCKSSLDRCGNYVCKWFFSGDANGLPVAFRDRWEGCEERKAKDEVQ